MSSVGDKQKVLFIGGLGRSGSTLVERLLNELPQTFAVGETIHLWERGVRDNERCGCGEDFGQCPHWSAVGESAYNGWQTMDVNRLIELRWRVDRTRQAPAIIKAVRSGKASAEQQEYVDHLERVLLASASAAGTPELLLESSKHLSTAALLQLARSLDVRVLHLVRDPRGVAYSWTKQVARPEAGDSFMPTYRPTRTAGRWVADNHGFEGLGRMGVSLMTMRYEDFLAQPVEKLQEIAQFAGLGGVDLSFLRSDAGTHRASLVTPMHSIAGNPLRFGGDEVTLRLDDEWKEALDPADRRLVTAICKPSLAHFGY